MTSKQLKKARRTLDLTQAQLGEKIGMSRVMIGLMERRKKAIDIRTELAVKHLLIIF